MPLKGPSKLVISSQSRSFKSPNSHPFRHRNVFSFASVVFYESSVNIQNRSKQTLLFYSSWEILRITHATCFPLCKNNLNI